MGLEAAVFVADLVSTNPDGADTKAEGDNHIRLIKSVLQSTFPGLAGRTWRSQTKSSGYTPVLGDNFSVFNCTAALTLSMTAAATLGNGYLVLVHANGGDVTIDPNGAETVNGAATSQIPNGFMGLLVCNAASFVCAIFPVSAGSVWSTGDVKSTLKTVADTGWVMMNDGTIGDGSSGGTTRANADTLNLFSLLWTNTADAQCAVSSGRGGSAAADFAAHKTIALPKILGRALAAAGAGSGLTSRVLALAFGEENHQLTTAELATHLHTAGTLAGDAAGSHAHNLANIREGDGGGGAVGGFTAGTINNVNSTSVQSFNSGSGGVTDSQGSHAHTISGSTANQGSGTAHNTMQPTSFLNFMVKL